MLLRLVILTTLFSMTGFAQTIIPQAGANPIVFDQTSQTDNLVFLMAGGAERNSGMTVGDFGSVKHMWITNFDDNTDYFKWNVSLATGGVYHVWALLNSGAAVPLRLSVEGQAATLDFTTRNIGWDKRDAGTINIPAGTSSLRLVRNSATSGRIEIKSLELIRESDRPAYETRVANFKRHPAWFSTSKYGLMLQFGPWGYPKTGARKSTQDFANTFDVNKLVTMVEATGARYVIWSLSWFEYKIIAPIKSIDSLSGSSNYTTTRDLLGEIVTALRGRGIRVFFYYNAAFPGSYGTFPPNFNKTGVGDRNRFFAIFDAVIGEIGARYGTKLDGWFFDDACNFYPARFEHLAAVARTGNPDRLISWNAWVACRFTDFQDVTMGEGSHGEAQFGSSAVGGNGVFTDGPQKGLMQHSMFVMGDDWGIHNPNQPINTRVTLGQSQTWVRNASARGAALSFDLEMWEDQTTAPASMDVLTGLKTSFGGVAIKNYTGNFHSIPGTSEIHHLFNVKGGRMSNQKKIPVVAIKRAIAPEKSEK